MNPLVTIAIPTLNRLDYLREAVASALAQNYQRVEVLIGDDGGNASINEWGRYVAARDHRVRYQRNSQNLGLAANWNALAKAATGQFLVIIGDDDRLLPEFVSTLLRIMRPEISLAFSNHYLIDDKGRRLEEESKRCTQYYGRDRLLPGKVIDSVSCVWRNSVPMSATLLRTKDVANLGFKNDLNTPEIEFFARLSGQGALLSFTPEYLAEYRVHDRSATANGLRSERLVKYLAPIFVAPDVEPFKRAFMNSLLIDAVGRCLSQSDEQQARRFLQHDYYPRSHRFTYLAQRCCAGLPTPYGGHAYRFLRRIKQTL